MITKILEDNLDSISLAATALIAGRLVAFPTETVYGLGANATKDDAVASIFKAKSRPSFNPLIIHFNNILDVKKEVSWNDTAEVLAKTFWPGPITLILNRKTTSQISLLASAGLETIAVRIPRHHIAQTLIEKSGFPIAAPSANESGLLSPTNAQHVMKSLHNRVTYILDGQATEIGLESTVIDLSREVPAILRPGYITKEQIEKTIKHSVIEKLDAVSDAKIISPGMITKHYSPNTPLRINATKFIKNEKVIGFGPKAPPKSMNLSYSSNLDEAASNLFKFLHELDHTNTRSIAVMPIPEAGLGIAINDRLRRASSKD